MSANKEMVVRSFQKCGISVPTDGSKDDEINVNSLQNYKVGDDDDSECELGEESNPFEDDKDSNGDEY